MTTTKLAPAPGNAERLLTAIPCQLLIGGKWRDGTERNTLSVVNPATGRPLIDIADAAPGGTSTRNTHSSRADMPLAHPSTSAPS